MAILYYPHLFFIVSKTESDKQNGVGQVQMFFLVKDKDKPKTTWYVFAEKVQGSSPQSQVDTTKGAADKKATDRFHRWIGRFNGNAQVYDAKIDINTLVGNGKAQVAIAKGGSPFLVRLTTNLGENDNERFMLQFDGIPAEKLIGKRFFGSLLNVGKKEPDPRGANPWNI